jgi:hypothetical protein
VQWEWWADDFGFECDWFGVKRRLDHGEDHRNVLYDTWLHTTHLNSAVANGSDEILVSLFHQGQIIAIDRAGGTVRTIVSGLRNPHGLRWNGDCLTFADTGSGTAVYGRLVAGDFQQLGEMKIQSNWLQDCQLIGEVWILVDGENSAVIFKQLDGQLLARHQFDERWLLYEVAL